MTAVASPQFQYSLRLLFTVAISVALALGTLRYSWVWITTLPLGGQVAVGLGAAWLIVALGAFWAWWRYFIIRNR